MHKRKRIRGIWLKYSENNCLHKMENGLARARKGCWIGTRKGSLGEGASERDSWKRSGDVD